MGPREQLIRRVWDRSSGVEFDQPFAWSTYFEDGRIRRWLSFTSHDEARAAAQATG